MPLGWAAWSGLHCWALKCDDISESPSRCLNMQPPPSPYCGAKVGWDWWKLLHRWMYWGTSPHCISNSQWALFVLLDYACKTHWNFHGGKPYPAWNMPWFEYIRISLCKEIIFMKTVMALGFLGQFPALIRILDTLPISTEIDQQFWKWIWNKQAVSLKGVEYMCLPTRWGKSATDCRIFVPHRM